MTLARTDSAIESMANAYSSGATQALPITAQKSSNSRKKGSKRVGCAFRHEAIPRSRRGIWGCCQSRTFERREEARLSPCPSLEVIPDEWVLSAKSPISEPAEMPTVVYERNGW